jgi:hypothetical protein
MKCTMHCGQEGHVCYDGKCEDCWLDKNQAKPDRYEIENRPDRRRRGPYGVTWMAKPKEDETS